MLRTLQVLMAQLTLFSAHDQSFARVIFDDDKLASAFEEMGKKRRLCIGDFIVCTEHLVLGSDKALTLWFGWVNDENSNFSDFWEIFFEMHSVKRIKKIDVMRDPKTNKGRGFVFVHFEGLKFLSDAY